MNDILYLRHTLPIGVRVEEISGGESYSAKVWNALSRQVYFENGSDGYRTISHFGSGAPCLDDSLSRISLAHTHGMLVVASLPKTPEADLSVFSPRTAVGVDVECSGRGQAMKVRDRFLDESEKSIVSPDSVQENIIAWTAKEAMLKAGMNATVDIRKDIVIKKMPVPGGETGEGVIFVDGVMVPLNLYTYHSGDFTVTVAYSPKCATFKKKG